MIVTADWLLSTSRLLGLFLTAPFLPCLPWRLRLVVPAVFALVMPGSPGPSAVLFTFEEPWSFVMACGGEICLGMALAWGVQLVLAAIRGAGSLIADQMGLALGGAAAPGPAEDQPALGSFYSILALASLVAIDGHHAILRLAANTFRTVPPGTLSFENALELPAQLLATAGPLLFEAACVFGLPVLSVLLLAALAQAFLSRVLPEADFFSMGPPLRAAVGLGAAFVALPTFVEVSRRYFELSFQAAAGAVPSH